MDLLVQWNPNAIVVDGDLHEVAGHFACPYLDDASGEVYLTALPTRFWRICRARTGSAQTLSDAGTLTRTECCFAFAADAARDAYDAAAYAAY